MMYVYPDGVKCTVEFDHHGTPKPGEMIRLTSEETRRKYLGAYEILFEVVECLDGSDDVWFKDEMPYSDGDGNDIQSKCLPGECLIVRYKKVV